MAPPLDFNATLAEQLRDAGMQMRAMTKPQKPRVAPDISPDAPPKTSPEASPVALPDVLADALDDASQDVSCNASSNLLPNATQDVTRSPAPSAAQILEHPEGAQQSAHGDDDTTQNSTRDNRTNSPERSSKKAIGSHTAGATAPASVSKTAKGAAHATVTDVATATAGDSGAMTPAQAGHTTSGVTDSAAEGLTVGQPDAALVCPTDALTDVATPSPTDNAAASATYSAGTLRTAAQPTSHTAAQTIGMTAGVPNHATDAVTATVTAENTALSTPPVSDMNSAVNSSANSHAIDPNSERSSHDDGKINSRDNGDVYSQERTHHTSEIDSHPISHQESHLGSQTNRPFTSPADTQGQPPQSYTLHGDSHPHMPHHAPADSAVAPSLPDAASELWAMSHHSEAPTLSERSWTGGVRGAVLDALRGLAGGRDHVLVNLKRLATHTGISYGSVRNAMSRLTRSGDIRTRQIRMADGHGVRVEFLTLPGQEGTGVATQTLASNQPPILGQSAILGQAALLEQAAMQSHEVQQYAQASLGMPFPSGGYAPTGRAASFAASATQAGGQHGHPLQSGFGSPAQASTGGYASPQTGAQNADPQGHVLHAAPYATQPTVTMTAGQRVNLEAEQWARTPPQGYPLMTVDEYSQFHTQQKMTPTAQTTAGAQQFGQQPLYQDAQLSVQQSAQQAAQQGSQPSASLVAPQVASGAAIQEAHNAFVSPAAPPHSASFWDTEDTLFALAWPHVATAGLRMEHVRALAPIFTVQGFDSAVLPRTLRYLDWELEQLGVPEDMNDGSSTSGLSTDVAEAARQHTQAFLRTMQRRGTWPRPAGYEEGDD